jgi:hypothetical protein
MSGILSVAEVFTENRVALGIDSRIMGPFLGLAEVIPCQREPAAAKLVVLLKNLNKYLENPNEESSKFLRIKESNATLRHTLFRVPCCVSILEAIGFVEVMEVSGEGESASASMSSITRLREFEYKLNKSTARLTETNK